MIYAILNETMDTVTNIAESYMALNTNWVQVPSGSPVSIGDTYDGRMFYSLEGELRITPEVEVTQTRIKELEEENVLKTAQIKALSDRNDFLEDCIAEMAGLIYA